MGNNSTRSSNRSYLCLKHRHEQYHEIKVFCSKRVRSWTFRLSPHQPLVSLGCSGLFSLRVYRQSPDKLLGHSHALPAYDLFAFQYTGIIQWTYAHIYDTLVATSCQYQKKKL
jgi:hypothetical protein